MKSQSLRTAQWSLALALIVILNIQTARYLPVSVMITGGDFIEYWSAARINLAGNLVEPLMLQSAGFSVTVVDVASSMLEQARQANLITYVANIEHETLPGGFDVVSCLEVLEHTVNPLGALKNISRCASSRGRLFVSLPNEFHAARRLQILFGRPDFSRYDWPHLHFFSYHSALELFAAAGLGVEEVAHMPLIPPRMKHLQFTANLLTRSCPNLFAISHVFELNRGASC